MSWPKGQLVFVYGGNKKETSNLFPVIRPYSVTKLISNDNTNINIKTCQDIFAVW